MTCHVCGEEAVARCYNCGQLMCDKHGRENCIRCDAGIAAGDPRGDRFSPVAVAPAAQKPGWWRPQAAEGYTPPACYGCGGLCRATCRECGSRYCRDHAGPNGLCRECGRSALLGPVILAILFTLFVGLILWGWLFGS